MSALVEHQSRESFHPPFKIDMGGAENQPLQFMQAVAVRPVDQPGVRVKGRAFVFVKISDPNPTFKLLWSIGAIDIYEIESLAQQLQLDAVKRDSVLRITANTSRTTFPYMKKKERFKSIHGFVPNSRFNQQQSATYRAFYSDQNYFDWNSKAILEQVGTTTGNFGYGNGLQISNIYNNGNLGSTGTRNASNDSLPSRVRDLQGQSKNRGVQPSCYGLGHCELEILSLAILFQNHNVNFRERRNQCENIDGFTWQSLLNINSAISLFKILLRFKTDAEILRRVQFHAIFQAILITQVLVQGVIFQAIKKCLERDFKVREKSDLREKTSKEATVSQEKENLNYSLSVKTTMAAYPDDGEYYWHLEGEDGDVGGQGGGQGQGIAGDIRNYDLEGAEIEWVEGDEEMEVDEEVEVVDVDVEAMLFNAYEYFGGNADEHNLRRVPGVGELPVFFPLGNDEMSREDEQDEVEGRRQLFDEFANRSFVDVSLYQEVHQINLEPENPPPPAEEEPQIPPPVNAAAA